MRFTIQEQPRWTVRYGQLGAISFVSVVLLSVMLLTGCSKKHADRLAVHPVAGQVTFNGKPAAGALVVFHPKDPTGGLPTPNAQVDPQGNYALTTYSAGDGAPVGEYNVTVVLRPMIKKDGEYLPGPNVLPPHVSKPDTSKLGARIAEGPNTVPIKITR